MSKIRLIAAREFSTRVKSKQFIILTLLAPFLLLLFFGVVALIAKSSAESKKHILVLDQSGLFEGKIDGTTDLQITFVQGNEQSLKDSIQKGSELGLLVVPKEFTAERNLPVTYFDQKPLGITTMSMLEKRFSTVVQQIKLESAQLDQAFIDQFNVDVNIKTFKLSSKGEEESSTGAVAVIGYIGSFLMYIFIFMYGMQVLKGVVEEKSSRIMEVIISSVKPFELMMGKILGIAGVGFLQFALWIILGFGVSTIAGAAFGVGVNPGVSAAEMEAVQQAGVQNKIGNLIGSLASLDLGMILFVFLFYFVGGYLLYASLFAAIGSAVDNEQDTQQLMFPITLPIILGFLAAQMAIQNPDSSVAFWFSMIPFTSPIVMMVRAPFGVPFGELLLSMSLLIAGFIGTTYLASRIYKIGVLMYGKKVTIKEISKWLFYKQ